MLGRVDAKSRACMCATSCTAQGSSDWNPTSLSFESTSMGGIRSQALTLVSAILLLGTIYSVFQETYLDTSNPLLTFLPHKLSETHYFASKANPLNVYFIKRSWGWTTAVFLFSYLTSPPHLRTSARFFQYCTLTICWLLFTSWFFGPAIIDRITVYSGAECVYQLPTGEINSVPLDLCYEKTVIAPETHPALFGSDFVAPAGLSFKPRLRRGHDVSGHVFLLTMSILFLAEQLKTSFSIRGPWPRLHSWAVASNIALLCIWLLGCYTTSVYFHTPFEKLTGYLLGISSFGVSLLLRNLFFKSPQPLPQQQVNRNVD
ncbi:FIT family protein scs3 [Psilocybe cubensis]|uniref:Uncharacterized protein n=2 Tax=Psilocybe cubensis TaxID=181762 RepID=A0A8H8CP36_PSICU|nr:FIT family protein scs3 [Psilocybe cubensis]KAH9485046.1 FIT family protein scs3 [Psilocybe cubensis]